MSDKGKPRYSSAHTTGRGGRHLSTMTVFLAQLAREEEGLHARHANVVAAAAELRRREEKAAHLRRAIAELQAYLDYETFEAEG